MSSAGMPIAGTFFAGAGASIVRASIAGMSTAGVLRWHSYSYPWQRCRGERYRRTRRRSSAIPPVAWRMGVWTPATMPFVGVLAIPHFWSLWGMLSYMRSVRRTHFGTITAPPSWHRTGAGSTRKSVRLKRGCILRDLRRPLDAPLRRRLTRPRPYSIQIQHRCRSRIDRSITVSPAYIKTPIEYGQLGRQAK